MNVMPMMSPAMTAVMTAVMMVAMMLPSLTPALRCYHRDLGALRISRAAERTMLFAVGYVGVWTAVSLLLFALSGETSSLEPGAVGVIVLCAGALQLSPWKTRQLAVCRESRVPALVSMSVASAWRDGCRHGVDCALSCAAPMAILLVAGLMNERMTVLVTVAITAERVMPAGARIARLTGTLALIAGVVIGIYGR